MGCKLFCLRAEFAHNNFAIYQGLSAPVLLYGTNGIEITIFLISNNKVLCCIFNIYGFFEAIFFIETFYLGFSAGV